MVASMSDTDPRPPRRRIHGVTWEWSKVWQHLTGISPTGAVYGQYRNDIVHLGFAMGCVKDDDGIIKVAP
jgi:hypothetical protein